MTVVLKISYYKCGTTDVSEIIHPTNSNKSKECMICHYWVFDRGFGFQDSVCNGCDDLTLLNVNISNIAIITIKNVGYRWIIHSISNSEELNLIKNYVLEERGYI